MLLSFERPSCETRATASSAIFENCIAISARHHFDKPMTCSNDTELVITLVISSDVGYGNYHRQDSKGTWWMPRHLEPMKGVNGCDKPRGGAE